MNQQLNTAQAAAFYYAQRAANNVYGAVTMRVPIKTAAAPRLVYLAPTGSVVVEGGQPESYATLDAFAQAYNLAYPD